MDRKTPTYVTRWLTCVDCSDEFEFTRGEQSYFNAKGLAEPKRCPACRAQRRRSLQEYKQRAASHQKGS